MTSNSTDTKRIRQFGIIALIFFGCLSVVGLVTGKTLPTCLFGFLALLGLGFIFIPRQFRPVYVTWVAVGHFVAKGINIGILALAYYLVMSPFALMMRLFGKRPLPVKPDRDVSSYWVTRTEPAQPKDQFLKRF
jgi:hypothetical protein